MPNLRDEQEIIGQQALSLASKLKTIHLGKLIGQLQIELNKRTNTPSGKDTSIESI